MINALRRKFVLTTISLLALVFAVVLIVLNLSVRSSERNKMLSEMASLAEAGRFPFFKPGDEDETDSSVEKGQPPAEMPAALPPEPVSPALPDNSSGSEAETETDPAARRARTSARSRRWMDSMVVKEMYLIQLDHDGNVLHRNHTYDFGYSDEEVNVLAQRAAAAGRGNGILDSYLYLVIPKAYGSLIILQNYSDAQASHTRLLFYSVSAGVGALLVLLAITILLSRRVTRPAERAFAQQKQFIADASHELKTPLSTISVNAEVLRDEIGPNKWLENISSECSRMEEMVISLLTLARLDAGEKKPLPAERVDLSEAVAQQALSFESVAFEAGVGYELDVEENVCISGSAGEVKQLVSGLIDNAIKYSDKNGMVRISLKKTDGHAVLTVSNAGKTIDKEDLPHLFERFYRTDSARTGGKDFGLGLAICREIVERHRGKITVSSEDGLTVFTVTF